MVVVTYQSSLFEYEHDGPDTVLYDFEISTLAEIIERIQAAAQAALAEQEVGLDVRVLPVLRERVRRQCVPVPPRDDGSPRGCPCSLDRRARRDAAAHRPTADPGGDGMSDNRPDPKDVSLEDAIERWLRKRQTDATEQTLRGYRSRMTQFLKWAIEQELETVAELDAWTLDEYQLHLRDQGFAPTTVKGRLNTVRLWIEYLEALDLVDSGLSDAIDVPNLSWSEEQSETRLAQDDALSALRLLRESQEHYGAGMHAVLEVIWHVGARMGASKALDLEDFNPEEQSLAF